MVAFANPNWEWISVAPFIFILWAAHDVQGVMHFMWICCVYIFPEWKGHGVRLLNSCTVIASHCLQARYHFPFMLLEGKVWAGDISQPLPLCVFTAFHQLFCSKCVRWLLLCLCETCNPRWLSIFKERKCIRWWEVKGRGHKNVTNMAWSLLT